MRNFFACLKKVDAEKNVAVNLQGTNDPMGPTLGEWENHHRLQKYQYQEKRGNNVSFQEG